MAEAGVQLSGSSSSATCSNTGSHSLAALANSLAALANSLAIVQLNQQSCSRAASIKSLCSHAASMNSLQPCSHAALFNSLAVLQPQSTALQLCSPNNSLVSVSGCEHLKPRILSR